MHKTLWQRGMQKAETLWNIKERDRGLGDDKHQKPLAYIFLRTEGIFVRRPEMEKDIAYGNQHSS